MRYMMLIYTKETENGPTGAEAEQIKAAHWAVMREATAKGVMMGAEPLAPTRTATTTGAVPFVAGIETGWGQVLDHLTDVLSERKG